MTTGARRDIQDEFGHEVYAESLCEGWWSIGDRDQPPLSGIFRTTLIIKKCWRS